MQILVWSLLALLTAGANRKTPVVEAVEKVGPAVVSVFSEQKVERSPFFSSGGRGRGFDLEELFGGRPRGGVALGSGVIIDGRGTVLTNAHVVSNGTRIKVQLADSREYDARILGADRTFDIAVLSLQGVKDTLPSLPMGQSGDLMIGETVIAIGNPLGLSHTVTTGVISALHRRVEAEGNISQDDLIQTDALINPGNSGGPLLNIRGELVGINAAIRIGQGASYAFAIPIDRARVIVEDLQRFGRVRFGWLGTRCQGMRSGGCKIIEVEDKSPAAAAGLKEDDIVLAIAGEKVSGTADFATRVNRLLDGQEVTFTLPRGKVSLKAVHLDAKHATERARGRLGLEVRTGRGAAVISRILPDGLAAVIGFRPGDLFVQVGQKEVATVEEFWSAVGQLRPGADATFVVQRGYYQYVVPLPL